MIQSTRAGIVRRHLSYFRFISLLLVLFLWNPLLHKSLRFPMVPRHPQCKCNLPAIAISRNRHVCAYPASFLITSHKALEAHQYRIDCVSHKYYWPCPKCLESREPSPSHLMWWNPSRPLQLVSRERSCLHQASSWWTHNVLYTFLLVHYQSVFQLSVVCFSHSLECEPLEVRSYAVFIFISSVLNMTLGTEQQRKMVSFQDKQRWRERTEMRRNSKES